MDPICNRNSAEDFSFTFIFSLSLIATKEEQEEEDEEEEEEAQEEAEWLDENGVAAFFSGKGVPDEGLPVVLSSSISPISSFSSSSSAVVTVVAVVVAVAAVVTAALPLKAFSSFMLMTSPPLPSLAAFEAPSFRANFFFTMEDDGDNDDAAALEPAPRDDDDAEAAPFRGKSTPVSDRFFVGVLVNTTEGWMLMLELLVVVVVACGRAERFAGGAGDAAGETWMVL